jgi:VanZ family protein
MLNQALIERERGRVQRFSLLADSLSMAAIPKRSYLYGVLSLFQLIVTLVSPFYTVPVVVWLVKRNLYRFTIALIAAPFFSLLAYFSMKRWPFIKKDRRMILILLASACSYIAVYETVPDMGEKLHVLNFSVLAFLIYKTFSPLMKLHWAMMLAWILPSAVAGFDEYLQNFIPGRAGTLHDVLIAVRSAILGGSIAWVFDAYSRKGRESHS